jgi:hypothetical protein
MRFRIGLVLGFAAGYYLGAMAGRERYEQINRVLTRARQSDALETVGEKTKAVVDLGMERARDVVESRMGDNGGPILSETR